MRQTIAFNFVLQIYSLLYYRSTRLVGTTGQRTTYACLDCRAQLWGLKNARYLSVKVFSTKLLIKDTTFTSPTGDGTAILRGHPSHTKVQGKGSTFISQLFSDPEYWPGPGNRTRDLPLCALTTALTLPLILNCVNCFGFTLLPGSHTIKYHFWQKRNSFRIPSFEKL